MSLTIVGIDCATDPSKTGLALAVAEGDRTALLDITTAKLSSPSTIIHQWIRDSHRVLLALDAPLGWPAQLSTTLIEHDAGEGLDAPADHLFRRRTDRFITETLGKRPLDVGADRIARTAHSALTMLTELRRLTGAEIPLAWSPKLGEQIQAIEVYPAGTLTALELTATGYKKSGDECVRREILRFLRELIDLTRISEDRLAGSADLLDAAICVQAAADFLQWRVLPPDDLELARREGWIWVRPRVR
jgi:predicted RNase H-like nuclease